MLIITLISGVLYEIYAAMLALTPVIIMNGIFATLVLIQLIMTAWINSSKSGTKKT